MVSWMLHGTPKEGMETCSRPLRGPKDTEYPEVYGPTGRRNNPSGSSGQPTTPTRPTDQPTTPTDQPARPTDQPARPTDQPGVDNPKCSITGQVQKTPGGPIQSEAGIYPAWENDDVMDSSTMTQNPLYASTFQFQVPSYKMDLSFPVEGPPQPYLTNFSRFHR
jgi:hypothetical protein